jgi:hypothetical protein
LNLLRKPVNFLKELLRDQTYEFLSLRSKWVNIRSAFVDFERAKRNENKEAMREAKNRHSIFCVMNGNQWLKVIQEDF